MGTVTGGQPGGQADSSGHRAFWPLPGGTGHYLESLSVFLTVLASRSAVDDVLDGILEAFPSVTSRKAARSYLHVVASLGFADFGAADVTLTPEGLRFLRTLSPELVRRALLRRIAGVPEILQALRQRPRRIGLLLEELRRQGFASWATDKQVRHRLRWMQECGVVGARGKARPEYFVRARSRAPIGAGRA